ncbi:MAG: purine-nucleoside phosphorylase, partial [Actinobacteria bacterium]|nr:purine-nucleoside phosphorylase [Actinomycetota bacterium]
MTGQAGDPYAAAAGSAKRLAELTGVERHDIAVVLGSGWAPAADAIGPALAEVPVAELGGFPEATVPGHAGMVRSLTVGVRGARRQVLVFLGRAHLYEGHSPATVVHGVRVAAVS